MEKVEKVARAIQGARSTVEVCSDWQSFIGAAEAAIAAMSATPETDGGGGPGEDELGG